MFRDGIKAMLEPEENIEVIGESDIADVILSDCERLQPDLVLMDISMQDTDGIEITKRLKSKNNTVKVLAVSMHNESHYVKSMLDNGASGYILKSAGRNEMISAIKTVHGGATFLSSAVSLSLLKGLNQTEENSAHVKLTPREIEVLKLIASGYTNHEIADTLYISSRTVDTHRRNLLEKLGLKNSAGLARFAIKNGYVS